MSLYIGGLRIEQPLTNNTGFVCGDCVEERHKKWQEENKDTIINPFDFVKVTFIEDDIRENIWVEVDKVEGDVIEGRLGNDPLLIEGLKINDPVRIKRDQIQQHIAK